jgi:hypothetical protein
MPAAPVVLNIIPQWQLHRVELRPRPEERA